MTYIFSSAADVCKQLSCDMLKQYVEVHDDVNKIEPPRKICCCTVGGKDYDKDKDPEAEDMGDSEAAPCSKLFVRSLRETVPQTCVCLQSGFRFLGR